MVVAKIITSKASNAKEKLPVNPVRLPSQSCKGKIKNLHARFWTVHGCHSPLGGYRQPHLRVIDHGYLNALQHPPRLLRMLTLLLYFSTPSTLGPPSLRPSWESGYRNNQSHHIFDSNRDLNCPLPKQSICLFIVFPTKLPIIQSILPFLTGIHLPSLLLYACRWFCDR